MKYKFLEAVHKEWLILSRDVPAFTILFVMPLLLIFVVTLAQERALKNQAERTSLCISSPFSSPLKTQIIQDIKESGMFVLISDSLSADALTESIAHGKVPLGIIIASDDSSITLLVDPTLHTSYKSSIINAGRFLIRGAQGKMLMRKMMFNTPSSLAISPESLLAGLPNVTIAYAVREKSTITPTPVQNNIPGFILFAMFFIVIPLSGSVIVEKSEGSFTRIRTLPVSPVILLGAKVFLFLFVCIAQFFLMFGVSHSLFHLLFDLPPLNFGSNIPALAIATFTAALAAVGFGLLVGIFSRTHAQAALFGSVMVLLLGILSGTFFPIHVMPKSIQLISQLSPVRWGIDNYLELFIRDGSISNILPRALLLFLFFIFAMLISVPIFAKRN